MSAEKNLQAAASDRESSSSEDYDSQDEPSPKKPLVSASSTERASKRHRGDESAADRELRIVATLETLSREMATLRGRMDTLASPSPKPTSMQCSDPGCTKTFAPLDRFCPTHGPLVPASTQQTTSNGKDLQQDPIPPSPSLHTFLGASVIVACLSEPVKKAASAGEYVPLEKFLPRYANQAALKANTGALFDEHDKALVAFLRASEHARSSAELRSQQATLGCSAALKSATATDLYTAFTFGLLPLACQGKPERFGDYTLFCMQFMHLLATNVAVESVAEYIEAVRMHMQCPPSGTPATHKLAAYNSHGIHGEISARVTQQYGWHRVESQQVKKPASHSAAQSTPRASQASSAPDEPFRLINAECKKRAKGLPCAKSPCPFLHKGQHDAASIAKANQPAALTPQPATPTTNAPSVPPGGTQ